MVTDHENDVTIIIKLLCTAVRQVSGSVKFDNEIMTSFLWVINFVKHRKHGIIKHTLECDTGPFCKTKTLTGALLSLNYESMSLKTFEA